MTTEDERRTELLPVLNRMKYARTDWSGSSHAFTIRLVNRLSRSELIAILQRLRVGDEQQHELERLCLRVRQERRQVGAALRRSGTWTHVGAFMAGMVVAAPLTWWLSQRDESGSSVDCPVCGPDSIATPEVGAGQELVAPAPVLIDGETEGEGEGDGESDGEADGETDGETDSETDGEHSSPESPPAVVEPSRKRATKAKPRKRDCKAVARELAQVLTNHAPRASQCDEDGRMTVTLGADGVVTTSGPLRGYPVEGGGSCKKVRVECPANW